MLYLKIVDDFFDLIYTPLLPMPPLLGLSIISMLISTLTLIIFRIAGNPEKRGPLRRQIRTLWLELRLYREDATYTLRLLARLICISD